MDILVWTIVAWRIHKITWSQEFSKQATVSGCIFTVCVFSAHLPSPIIFIQPLNWFGWSANQPNIKHKRSQWLYSTNKQVAAVFCSLFFVYVFMHIQASVKCCFAWHNDLNLRRGKECFRRQCLNLLCVLLFVYLKYFDFLGSGCQCVHFHLRDNALELDSILLVLDHWGGNMPFSLPVHLSVSRRGGEGGLCHLSLRRDWQKICVDCVWFQPSPHPG